MNKQVMPEITAPLALTIGWTTAAADRGS